MRVDKEYPSKTRSYYCERQRQRKQRMVRKHQRKSVREQTSMEHAVQSPPVFKLEVPGGAGAVADVGGRLKVVSVWKVPDLTFNGFRQPELSRQFVVELNQAVRKDVFIGKVKRAFDS